MAPEQLRGGRVDASVDLYAAALVSLTLVAGTPPRTAADRAHALAAFGDDRVRAALDKALADDPAARFASAVELAAALGDEPSGETIDYRIERQRHDGFVGRDALLARLDQLLGPDGPDGHGRPDRWVVVTGGPGMGKSAVLAAWLARREAAGAVVPHHFIRRGDYDWDDPARLVASLVAQIENQFPDHREPVADAQSRPAARLAATLTRISANVLVPRGERLVVLIDGLDEYDPPAGAPSGDPLAAFLPHALPDGVSFLCASRPRHLYVSALEARDGELVRIDLDDPDFAADNDATVRRLWERAAPPLGLDREFVDEAVTRACGNLQHAVTLRKHVAGLPAAQRQVEAIPRGLAALLVKLWQRIATHPIAEAGLGILCAAREALTLDELGVVAGWTDAAHRQAFLRGASELLVETRRTEDRTEYRLHHDAIRAHVAAMVGAAALRGHHAALARQLATWPPPADATARRYALRHALTHLTGAGDWPAAWRLAADMSFLEVKCRELGAHEAEADVVRAAERCRTSGDEATGQRFDELARALVRESHWLRDAPAAVSALVWNRLRRSGWSVEDLDDRLKVSAGATFLRVRRTATRASATLVRNLVGHAGAVHACVVTSDGRRVISASEDYLLKVWDLASGRVLATLEGHTYGVTACAVTPSGRRVVSASNDRTLRVWDLDAGRALATFHGHAGAVNACVVTPDGRRVVSASDDRTLKVWELDTGRVLATFEGHARTVTACAVTPDGDHVVSASSDGTLKLWDFHTGRVLATLESHGLRVTACAVTPDGRRVVSASSDRTLKLWDLDTGRVLVTFKGHADSVTACAVTPDGRRVVSASGDQTLTLWDLDTGRALASFEGHTLWVTSCAVTPDGRRMVSASSDRTLRVWDLVGGRMVPAFEGHTDVVTACAVTPDDRRAVSASDDRTLKIWDLAGGRVVATFKGHTDCVTTCAVTPDGSRVVSGSRDRTLRVWELDSGHVRTIFKGHTDTVTACAVAPDGLHVVSASKDRTLRVWELDTGRVLTTFGGHADPVTACAVTPDGRRVVSTSWDALKLWELDSGRLLASFTGRTDWVTTCAITPDGRRVVSGSRYQTLVLWDLDSQRVIAGFDGPAGGARACAVTPDGRRVVSASPDHTLEVWDLDTHARVLAHRGDAPYTAVATSATTMVAGDDAGTVWFLDWPRSPSV
jgi:WD40 repeat protein